jgi:hypothetical protein
MVGNSITVLFRSLLHKVLRDACVAEASIGVGESQHIQWLVIAYKTVTILVNSTVGSTIAIEDAQNSRGKGLVRSCCKSD